MKDLAARFGALADPTRLEMLVLLLSRGELCVCDFVEGLGISQSKASRHLRALYHAGLLEDRREGLWVFYRVAPDLDPERKAILSMAARIFAMRDLAGLERRLDAWLSRKNSACKTDSRPRTAAEPPRRAR